MVSKSKTFDISLASETDRKTLQNSITEASASLMRIDSEKDHIGSIYDTLITQVEIPRTDFNFLVNTYHKQNKDEVAVKHEQRIELYEKVFKDE